MADVNDDIGSSRVYAILDSLRQTGRVSAEICEDLKTKYESLQDLVIDTVSNEKALLRRAQELNEQSTKLQDQVSEHNQTVSSNQETIDDLKQKLENSIFESQEVETNIDMVSLEIEAIVRNNDETEKEGIERRKQSDLLLQPQTDSLNKEIDLIKDEISSNKQFFEKETNFQLEMKNNIENSKTEIEDSERNKLHKRQKLIKLKSEPERLEIQSQTLLRQVHAYNEKITQQKMEYDKIIDNIENVSNDKKSTDTKRYNLAEKLMRLRDAIEKKEKEIDDITRRVEHAKNKINDCEELRMQLTIEVSETKMELKRETDSVNKLNRLYDEVKKKNEVILRKKDFIYSQIAPIADEFDHLNKRYNDIKKETALQSKQNQLLREDCDIYISNFLNKEDVETKVLSKLNKLKTNLNDKDTQLKQLMKQERVMQDKIRQITLRKDILLKESAIASTEIHQCQGIFKVKEIYVMDLNKKLHGINGKLKNTRHGYEIIKNSRNKFANLVTNAHQALSEMKEKMKIVVNELEILKNENISKETALLEEIKILQAAQYSRDQLRFELNKANNVFTATKQEIAAYSMDIAKLDMSIKSIDNEMSQLKETYESAVTHRNTIGLNLIDKNDQLSLLHEKCNVYQSILNKSNVTLSIEIETKINSVKLEIKSHKNTYGNVKLKKIPSDSQQRQISQRYSKLANALKESKSLVVQLSKQLSVPNPSMNPTRYRKIENHGIMGENLSGSYSLYSAATAGHATHNKNKPNHAAKDPTFDQLSSQIAVLSKRCTIQKEKILEKDLIHSEVSQLTQTLKLQASENHETTLALAKKMNEMKFKISKINYNMMAVISELSLYQASHIKLSQDKELLQKLIETGKDRLYKQYQYPFEDALTEWKQMEMRRQYIAKTTTTTSATDIISEDESTVTASVPPRPNAYIADDIGIPKPYGAHAPFKPSKLGSTMRHIRKPSSKQIIL